MYVCDKNYSLIRIDDIITSKNQWNVYTETVHIHIH